VEHDVRRAGRRCVVNQAGAPHRLDVRAGRHIVITTSAVATASATLSAHQAAGLDEPVQRRPAPVDPDHVVRRR
jgi:hypothetical protein